MNDQSGFSKEACEKIILQLEESLALKSKQLTEQVMYNSFTLFMGLVVGFLASRFLFKKTK